MSQAVWMPMTAADLPTAVAIAELVHSNYPEDPAVVAERLALHPAGCLMLRREGRAIGYLVSHPWRANDAPALDTLLGALPEHPGTFYIHDLALLPEARGMKAGQAAVALIAEHARALGLSTLSLTAVNHSVRFWEAQGFTVSTDPAWTRKLASYGPDAAYMVKRLE